MDNQTHQEVGPRYRMVPSTLLEHLQWGWARGVAVGGKEQTWMAVGGKEQTWVAVGGKEQMWVAVGTLVQGGWTELGKGAFD